MRFFFHVRHQLTTKVCWFELKMRYSKKNKDVPISKNTQKHAYGDEKNSRLTPLKNENDREKKNILAGV